MPVTVVIDMDGCVGQKVVDAADERLPTFVERGSGLTDHVGPLSTTMTAKKRDLTLVPVTVS